MADLLFDEDELRAGLGAAAGHNLPAPIDAVRRRAGQRRRHRRTVLAFATALVVVTTAAVGVAQLRSPRDADVTTVPSPVTPQPTPTDPSVPTAPPSDVELGASLDPQRLALPEQGVAVAFGESTVVVLVGLDGEVLGHLTGYSFDYRDRTPAGSLLLEGREAADAEAHLEGLAPSGAGLWRLEAHPSGSIPLGSGTLLCCETGQPAQLVLGDGQQITLAPGHVAVSADGRWVTVREPSDDPVGYVGWTAYEVATGNVIGGEGDCLVADTRGPGRLLACDTELRIDDGTGDGRVLGASPYEQFGGHWGGAQFSPDGATILGLWSGECESPSAFFVPSDGGLPAPVGPQDPSIESSGLGWAADGRAVVHFHTGVCGGTLPDGPGIYLVGTDGSLELVYATGVTSFVGATLWTSLPG